MYKYHETAHAVWSMVKSKDVSMRSGFGWDDNPRHNKGVYSTLSLRHIESSKFNNLSLERSNGRCPGVWIHLSRGDLVSTYCTLMDIMHLFTEVSLRLRISYRRGLWRCICVVHWKTIFLICYLLDYQQVQESSNVSIILLGDKKEPTKWKTNLVQQILLPNNHFPCYFYFKNHFYWRKEKRCVTCLWLPTKANTQI